LAPFILYQIFYTNDINIIRVHYYRLKQKDSLVEIQRHYRLSSIFKFDTSVSFEYNNS